jgi:hypothetical protein
MSGVVGARRTIGLLALAIAALLVLAAPLGVPEADAKKKKKKINVVQCQPNSETGNDCFGTQGRDRMVGTDSGENIFGQGGNDVYQANGGKDNMFDTSLTSSDTYTGYSASFTFFSDRIKDDGGSSDFLDLGSLRALDDIALVRIDDPDPNPDNLFLDGPGFNDILIVDHFGQGRIEKIKFANGTITGAQAQSLAREATTEEQATLEKSFEEERPPEDESPTQEEKE